MDLVTVDNRYCYFRQEYFEIFSGGLTNNDSSSVPESDPNPDPDPPDPHVFGPPVSRSGSIN